LSGGCQISWLFFQAVRAGLAVTKTHILLIRVERVRQPPDRKTANWLRPKGLR